MFRIYYDLPIETNVSAICQIVEGMFPAPKNERGSPIYYRSNIADEYTKEIVRIEHLKAEEYQEDEPARFAYRYSVPLLDEYPKVEISEQFDHVRSRHYTQLEIRLAKPKFSADTGSGATITRSGLSLHNLADIQAAGCTYRYAVELMRRLKKEFGEEALSCLSAVISGEIEAKDLLADFTQVEPERGLPRLYKVFRPVIPYDRAVALVEQFGLDSLPQTFLGMIYAACVSEEDKIVDAIVSACRRFLRTQERLPGEAISAMLTEGAKALPESV